VPHHRISRTDTVIKICFTQQIGMNVRSTGRLHIDSPVMLYPGRLHINSPVMFRTQIDRVCSLVIHQVSTWFLLGKLGSWFVSVGSVYCSIKAFVTFGRSSSRFCESCVGGPPTCLCTDTLNWLWKYPQVCPPGPVSFATGPVIVSPPNNTWPVPVSFVHNWWTRTGDRDRGEDRV
jgi:hypothetical protein